MVARDGKHEQNWFLTTCNDNEFVFGQEKTLLDILITYTTPQDNSKVSYCGLPVDILRYSYILQCEEGNEPRKLIVHVQ